MSQTNPPNKTTFEGGLWMKDTSGNYVEVIDANGNIDAPVTTTDLTTTGNTTLGNAVTDTTAINGATTITTTSASGLAVGRQGATSPVLKINAATASVATGVEVTGAASGSGVVVAAIGGTNEALTLNAKGSGSLGLNSTAGSTGAVLISNGTDKGGMSVQGASTISAANSGALQVGPNGTTNPTLQIDTVTASAATGLQVKSAAAAGGLAVSVISSGTDENLTVDAKGAGTITLGGTSTGNVVLGRAMTGVSTSVTGAATMKSGTAVPATAGAVAAGAPLVMNSNGITIECTTDVPTHTRPKGSICINLGGSSTTTRMYINTDGAGTWTPFTTGA